jgi:HK97 family phage portal protein
MRRNLWKLKPIRTEDSLSYKRKRDIMAFDWSKIYNIASKGAKSIGDIATYDTLLQAFVSSSKAEARSLTAYARGVQAIAEAVAQVKFEVHEQKDGYTRKKKDDSLNYLINTDPNVLQNAFDFWRTATEIVLYKGNCFIKVIRNESSGKPTSLEIQHSNYRPTSALAMMDGEKRLYWIFEEGKDPIADRDLIHLKFSGAEEDLLGVDPLTQFSDTIGLSRSTEKYATNVYKKNGNLSVVLTTEKAMNDEQIERLRTSWNQRYSGDNAEATVILEEGMDAKPIQIRPDQAKFLENRKFQIQEIARILGVPTPILMDYSDYNYNTAETADLDFYKRSISPKVDYIEKELSKKLLSPKAKKAGERVVGDVRPLFRADMETRVKYLQDRFSMGSITPNEVRMSEGDAPKENEPAMDKTYIMSNLAPADKIEGFYDKNEEGGENNGNPNPIETEEQD